MDITQLPRRWRGEADRLPGGYDDNEAARLTLRRCADELDLAWHQHAHDGAFDAGCKFCDWEREHNDNYPEERH